MENPSQELALRSHFKDIPRVVVVVAGHCYNKAYLERIQEDGVHSNR